MHQLANFPHIVEAITASFTFTDLLNCLRVSHAWHGVFAPILYLDVVTSRADFDRSIVWYNDPFTHFALHKYAHHIRAITCHGSDIHIQLSNSECHLRDINYFVDSCSPLGIQLDHLASLVARNPGLLAVSIEEVNFHSSEDLESLLKFVRFLDAYPSITCFFLDIELSMNPNVCKALLEILERRLDLIKTDSVKCLDLAPNIARSNRGPPWPMGQQQSWPARERPRSIWLDYVLKDQRSYGRWDNETCSKPCEWNTLAVMDKGERAAGGSILGSECNYAFSAVPTGLSDPWHDGSRGSTLFLGAGGPSMSERD